MKEMFHITDRSKCTGCGVCANICPPKAISMSIDGEGFYKPNIDTDKCINCHLCVNTCPVNGLSNNNLAEPDCYAVMASDEVRAISSSGGAFTLIANEIFRKNGCVCGVAYSDDCMKTKFIMIDDPQQMYKLRGSKYIMSDTGDIYTKVRDVLRKQRRVLFVGLPCHVAGLKSFLKNEANSFYLLTVDLICHGNGSVKAFGKYMRDVHGKKKMKSLGFKDKRYGWPRPSMVIEFDDGSIYSKPCETDSYFISFVNGLNKNRSCGACPFAKIPRQGDITIGDFWGISRYNPNYSDTKGTSVMLFNNERGKSYLEEIKKNSKLFEPVPLEYAIAGNSNLIKSPSVKISSSQFLRKLDTRRYPDLVQWGFGDNRYDIGLVGIPIYPNFGGTLTYYSLYRSLRDMGYSVALFSRPRSTGKPPIAPEGIYNVCPFEKSDLKLDFKDKKAIGNYANANCDSFIVGSDQLFNSDLYKAFGEIVTLDWVTDNHRKVAYAASFGHDFFWGPEQERAKMSYYMQKFDAFSVREEEGVSLAKSSFGVNAEWVLDPVFLCDPRHYINVSETSSVKNSEPHIFSYILDPTDEKEEILFCVEEELNLSVELYSEMLYMPQDKHIDEWQKKFKHTLLQGKVENRLYSLIHSDFVVTDSFHGVCFAIIFNKPFIAILNPLRGAARFYTILGKLNLLDRLVTNVDEVKQKKYLLDKNIDLSESQTIIAKEKERCLIWLKNAIDPTDNDKKGYSAEDIIDEKLKQVSKYELINDIKSNAALSGRNFYAIRNIYDYLDTLIKDKNHLIIFISVKDTPGYALNKKIDTKLSALGLKISLVDKHWHSYVAVINGSNVIKEIISEKEERVVYAGNLPCGNVKVLSRSFNFGNTAFIAINDIDYSENKRGLNFVVYDKLLGGVVDSVCFDTHDALIPFYRFNKRFGSNVPLPIKLEMMNSAAKYEDRIVHSADLSKNELDIFYCCCIAAEHCNGRKIVLWEYDKRFIDVLKKCFDIEVSQIIADMPITGVNIPLIKFDDVNGKNKEYYIIIPNRKYSSSDELKLNGYGFTDVSDFVYRYIRPIVIKDRNFAIEPYSDIYMNRITGNFAVSSTIIIKGYNNVITVGNNITGSSDAQVNIECDSNSEITIGNNVRFINKIDFISYENFSKKITIADRVVFNENQLRVFGDIGTAEISIGKGTTFNPNTIIHVFAGKKLSIGEDVMFSNDIRVLCGDGHSIFDVDSQKNTNSIFQPLDKSKNEIVIGDHVWVDMNAMILCGSVIESGSIIGANSLVKGYFPNNCAIGGNPAKLLKKDVAWSRRNCSEKISDCDMRYVTPTYEETDLANKNVLVLGGTKLMGIRLVEKLIERGALVTIATRGNRADSFGDRVQRVIIDRNVEQSIIDVLKGQKYDVIFDNSAYTPLNVRYALTHIQCNRYILVSTAGIYENHIRFRTEDMVDPYHVTYNTENNLSHETGKRYAECVLCQEFGTQNSAIVRVPAVLDEEKFQDGQNTDRLFFYVEHIAKNIPFYEHNLDRVCSLIRTSDEADFLIYLATKSCNGVFNISAEGKITLREIIGYIENRTGKKALITEDGDKNPAPFGGYQLDLTKTKKIGFTPENITDWIYKLLDKYISLFEQPE